MALDRDKYKILGNSLDVARMWPEKDHPLEVGESIEGTFVEKLEGFGTNNSNVYILQVGDERVGVWGSAVIDENMKDVAIGSAVGFEFGGMRESKRGTSYKDFRVGVSAVSAEQASAGTVDEPAPKVGSVRESEFPYPKKEEVDPTEIPF